MGVITVYARLYTECFFEALEGIRRNLWTLILPVLVIIGYVLLSSVAAPMGFAGGFLIALGRAALLSGYLYFLAEVVAKSRVTLRDLKTSLGVYFWSLVNLFFVIFVANFLLGRLVGLSGALLLVINLVALIAFNAAPEMIYQRGTHGGLATFQASLQFLQDNWLEWIVPNVPLFLLGWGFIRLSASLPPGGDLPLIVIAGALAHVAMVFRGRVFAALVGSSHRQRMFKHRNG